QRPPASCPCQPWFCRRLAPFFRANEGGVGQQFLQVEFAQLAEFFDQQSLDVLQDFVASPLLEPAPAGAPGRQVERDVPPPRTAAQQPQDALQAFAVGGTRSASLRRRRVLGQMRRDALPLLVGQEAGSLP